MTSSEKMKVLFTKRDKLAQEMRQTEAALNEARRGWADEQGLLMLPPMARIQAQVMA